MIPRMALMANPPRLARIIGVSKYDAETINNIEVAERDVAAMTAALRDSGYQVDVLTSTSPGRHPTRNGIKEYLEDALEEAPEESTLFLYFSGHGIHVEGKDYLCPSDT